ncbi:PaaI family thioesterase [Dactylosporangium salmoneum]|uniref:Acyl-coenzyme A thioesterase THEM4 n=1 Tax=Dactylosporangium salmoneum TaxID=53361 RepID=A0ABP5TT94_9ACTN
MGQDWTQLERALFDPAGHPGRVAVAEAVRELMRAVATTTAATDDELGEVAGRLRQITAGIVAGDRCVRYPLPTGPFSGRVLGSGDPVFGMFNPVAGPLVVTIEPDGTAAGVLTPSPLFEGPGGAVHGGYTAFLVDAVMGTLLRALGISALTGTLSVRYLALTPLARPLHLSAWVESTDGRKVTAAARITVDGRPTVTATGLFIAAAGPAQG